VWGSRDPKRDAQVSASCSMSALSSRVTLMGCTQDDMPPETSRSPVMGPQRAATFSAPVLQLHRQSSPGLFPARASRSGGNYRSVVHSGFLTQRGSQTEPRALLSPTRGSRRSISTRGSNVGGNLPEIMNGSPRRIEAYARLHTADGSSWAEADDGDESSDAPQVPQLSTRPCYFAPPKLPYSDVE